MDDQLPCHCEEAQRRGNLIFSLLASVVFSVGRPRTGLAAVCCDKAPLRGARLSKAVGDQLLCHCEERSDVVISSIHIVTRQSPVGSLSKQGNSYM